ncbi:hypothetical protein MHYP_G00003480 [Metynnis hypsauchen]
MNFCIQLELTELKIRLAFNVARKIPVPLATRWVGKACAQTTHMQNQGGSAERTRRQTRSVMQDYSVSFSTATDAAWLSERHHATSVCFQGGAFLP